MADESAVRSTLNWLTAAPPPRVRGRRLAMAAEATVPDWTMADGVTAFGLAEKETSGRILDEIALKVYVERKLPLNKLAHPIPAWIDHAGVRVTTDVVEIGKVVPQSNTAHVRPAPPGYSIGRAVETGEAGTFGMVVRKTGQTTPLYLLSNSHAIAACGFASVGDAIVQPGCYDGGTAPADTIGALEQWVPFQYTATGFPNLVDAAIAKLGDDVATAAIAVLGVPDGVNTDLRRGQYVQKMGRTTTLSVALVKDVDLRVPATYPDAKGQPARVGFSDQVLVTYYSAGGDSGSPVLDMDNNVVGLHVAGSPVIGIFCKIANVMNLLGVEVVTTQNLASSMLAAQEKFGGQRG
jgi:hypothetical protein